MLVFPDDDGFETNFIYLFYSEKYKIEPFHRKDNPTRLDSLPFERKVEDVM